MKQYPSNPPISTGLHDSISSTSDPPILATSAPTDSIALRERQTKVETEADQEKRRTSVPNILQTSLSSASTESVPRSPETNSGKSNNHPIDRGRRGSFREIVGTKFTSFSRRLSQQSHSPRTKSRLLSEPDFDQSQSAATLSPLFRELHRPSEWPDKTEIDYLKRKNSKFRILAMFQAESDFYKWLKQTADKSMRRILSRWRPLVRNSLSVPLFGSQFQHLVPPLFLPTLFLVISKEIAQNPPRLPTNVSLALPRGSTFTCALAP